MEKNKEKIGIAVIGAGGLSKAEQILHDVEKEKITIIDPFANTPMIIKPYPEIIEEFTTLSKKERNFKILPINTEPKIGRNQPCPCLSGKKYKHCCGKNK